jgi:S-(hydroxymethyl)glutathione dehydrogenase/alcohol dehydrogenase
MKTLAAILTELGKPLEVDEIEIPSLLPGQVLVEIQFSGVCHTQLSEVRGKRGEDRFLPHCLGHEASAIVREVGGGVSQFKADDRVVVSWIKGSGADVPSTRYKWGSKIVNAGAVTTFSRLSVVSENRLSLLDPEVSFRDGALLGCAIPTGFGAVFNTARARPGQSLLIYGFGGIGSCILQAARLVGCCPIVVVDIKEEKLRQAKQQGADHALLASERARFEEILGQLPRGFDLAIDSSGAPEVMQQLLQFVRPQGGVAIVVGNAPFGEKISLDPRDLNAGKQLRGSWGGDNHVAVDFPRYQALLTSGRVSTKQIIGQEYRLAEINSALTDLERGMLLRPLINCSLA